MEKQFREPTEEDFRKICKKAGLTEEEWVMNSSEKGFTEEGIKKLRDFFISQGDFGCAYSFNQLLNRKLKWQFEQG